jgi:hypothetical protein
MPVEARGPGPGSANGRGAWLCALLLWAAGGAIIGVAAGWLPADPRRIHAPHWLLAVAGLAFVACGFAPLAARARPGSWPARIAGLGTIGALTVMANWVAFGSGPRRFSGGLGVGELAISPGHPSALGGRIAFGIGAVILDGIVVLAIARRLRADQRLRQSQR